MVKCSPSMALLAGALALVACSEAGGTPEEFVEDAPAATGEAPADIAVEGEERRILAFGDSLFAGYNLAEHEGYPERLEDALREDGINARVIDAGVSGDTTAAGRQRFGFVLDQAGEVDLVVIELGGNDLLRNIQPAQTRANLAAMIEEAQSRNLRVLLMGMRAPPNYGPEFQAEFDAIYSGLAEEYDVALVPFWLEGIYRDPSLFQSDRIHPTAAGIERLVADTADDVRAALPS